MSKVEFNDDSVLVDGVKVGRLDGTKEVYVYLKDVQNNEIVVARFKYRKPKASAKHWLRFMLRRMDHVKIVDELKDLKTTPLELASSLGYVSLNMIDLQILKRQLQNDGLP